jgi:hypothetical protein
MGFIEDLGWHKNSFHWTGKEMAQQARGKVAQVNPDLLEMVGKRPTCRHLGLLSESIAARRTWSVQVSSCANPDFLLLFFALHDKHPLLFVSGPATLYVARCVQTGTGLEVCRVADKLTIDRIGTHGTGSSLILCVKNWNFFDRPKTGTYS